MEYISEIFTRINPIPIVYRCLYLYYRDGVGLLFDGVCFVLRGFVLGLGCVYCVYWDVYVMCMNVWVCVSVV